MQKSAYSKLAEALVFVHGDHALDEAKRHFEFNQRNGNEKLAANWALAMKFVEPAHLPKLDQAA
jgi:hypothetical protein